MFWQNLQIGDLFGGKMYFLLYSESPTDPTHIVETLPSKGQELVSLSCFANVTQEQAKSSSAITLTCFTYSVVQRESIDICMEGGALNCRDTFKIFQ